MYGHECSLQLTLKVSNEGYTPRIPLMLKESICMHHAHPQLNLSQPIYIQALCTCFEKLLSDQELIALKPCIQPACHD